MHVTLDLISQLVTFQAHNEQFCPLTLRTFFHSQMCARTVIHAVTTVQKATSSDSSSD